MKRHNYIYLSFLMVIVIGLDSNAAPRNAMRTRSNEHFDKGAFVSFSAGSGISRLDYSVGSDQATMLHLQSENRFVFPSFSASIGFRYYFLPWLGVRTGLDFSTYSSQTDLSGEMVWGNTGTGQNPLYDYAGDSYEHHTAFRDWTERQDVYLIEIPLGLSFKYKPRKIGAFADLGVKAGIPIWSNYKQLKGDLIHTAWYPLYNLELSDIPSRFETEPWQDNREGALAALRTVNALAFAELGVLFQVHPRLDLTVSLYGNYMVNSQTDRREISRELGFSSDFNGTSAFMESYQGLLNTTAVGTVHPWSAGVKVGLNVYCGRNKAQRKKQMEELAEAFPKLMPHDTVYVTLHDTLILSVPSEVTVVESAGSSSAYAAVSNSFQTLDSLLSETVIWFDFDSDVPNLEPANILDSIGNVLRQNPELQISINGHACVIGSERYNNRLAARRALVVYRALQEKGVSSSQMTVASFGAHVPFHYSPSTVIRNSESDYERDRRVEIVPSGVSVPVSTTEYDVIRRGTTLSRLARKWYDCQPFWVYIYEANKDVLPDPNHPAVGTRLVIPSIEAILHGESREDAIERAHAMEAVICQP